MGELLEEMFFFDGVNDRRLLGFLHPARNTALGAILYCQPFAEEQNLSHHVASRTARQLAALGYWVLRFDFSGCGDSEGQLEEASAEHWIAEIGIAAELLKTRSGFDHIGLWGLRTGAGLASIWGRYRRDIEFAIWWQPTVDFKLFMTQFLRQKLASSIGSEGSGKLTVSALVSRLDTGEIIEVMGYPLSSKLFHSLSGLGSNLDAFAEFTCPTCILSISESESTPMPLLRLAEVCQEKSIPSQLRHIQEMPFWDRYWRSEAPATENETLNWVKERH